MANLALELFGAPDMGGIGLWLFLSVGAVALFMVFIPLVTWIESRRKEREAFYKAETFRRMVEASGEGAKAAVELVREEDRLKRIKVREGMKIGGVINIGVGLGLVIFLGALFRGGGSINTGGPGPVYLCGLIPAFVGVAMLVYVYLLATPVE